MEKTLQRQLLEMLQTLEEGIRYIGQEGNPAMLRECITAIRAIRETCQQSLPVRRQAVYVDLFDGMAQALQQLPDQADQATLQQSTDLCQELIEYARQALQKELTRKKIMVFLPYKASMWDSLESVWKAAYEDKEHCETYVIPIPYCDRNPDMTAKEWHCEAGLFPDYVPVLDWREYSRDKLREMHPDVIFIHNPYDNFNAVTSVDMQYYSRNLKGIADKLVYIPYFVVGDTIAPHFCQTQGVINADYVIVQDENIKAQYERYYPGGNPPKGKILALGSPKFDKVCNTTKDDYILPEEWQRLIGNKKVILYNTSLTAMLQNVNKFNAKLRYVFDIFKQRDDVILWWRPHPLLRATIDSMTPEIRDEYRQIEQQYIDEGWGIYDDTPELDRAIVCTDAYYGDLSSLIWLYRETGKPIVVQNIGENDRISLAPISFCIAGDKTYFLDMFSNLGIIDKAKNLISYREIFNEQRASLMQKYTSMYLISNTKLLFAPFAGNEFLLYDLENDVQRRIDCKTITPNMGTIKFHKGQRIGDKLFFVGYEKFCIIYYDLKQEKFGTYEDIYNFDNIVEKDEIWQFVSLKFSNHLLALARNTNTVFDMDTVEMNTRIVHIGEENYKYNDAVGGERFLCFKTTDNKLVFWNYEKNADTEVVLPESFQPQYVYWLNICMSKKYAYVLASYQNNTVGYISINLETWAMSQEKIIQQFSRIYMFAHYENEQFLIGGASGNKDFFIHINMDSLKIKKSYEIFMDERQKRKILYNSYATMNTKFPKTASFWLPESLIDLKNMCSFIQCKKNRGKGKDSTNIIGNLIYYKYEHDLI